HLQRRKLRGALDQPKVLRSCPVAIVPLARNDLPAAWTAMLCGTPGIEGELRSIVRTHPAVSRKEGLRVREIRHADQQRGGPLTEMRVQGRKIARARDRLPSRRGPRGAHHARTPSDAHRTGSTIAPTARAADAAVSSAGPFVVTKKIDPPAHPAAAVPP